MNNIGNNFFVQNDTESEDTQFAENQRIVETDVDIEQSPTSEEKRELLKKTKIVKQTWSIQEIYQKIKTQRLKLSPDYQRNEIWQNDKNTAFIESLYMGIIVPPIYVVEIPGADILEDSTYEVVDGKQRLTAINKFLTNQYQLTKKALEYYKDWFGGKLYSDIRDEYPDMTSEMLSSVLDIYVITANSPEFTKYDIFSRLNKGAEKLKVNEIRKAIYRSELLLIIDKFVSSYTLSENKEQKEEYESVFTPNDIKRYDDYGRFYSSIAFCIQSDLNESIVRNYNSRPRDMINYVLQKAQDKSISLLEEQVMHILNLTFQLKKKYLKIDGIDYIINSCIPFYKQEDLLMSKMENIISDEVISKSLEKSPATTSNVNLRLSRVKTILSE
ncbi:DUF262 domain-containing protein [uncultured Bacteroides sp.]|uniref:DUF262 domain-containing protein n=1 Tax=uncultured Bacteroides sp. TaxID=162156 RepID=UPI0025F3AB85|nr:DUF262 domain-containing protein [uncultured Bacteroides sp.]